jgi:transcriptional regulator with PAS, ATPase and Fis domain
MELLHAQQKAPHNTEERQIPNDGELNLARMEISTIKKAFLLYPQDPVTEISKKLSISSRTLHRKMKQYNLGSPRELRYPDKIKKK